MLLHRYGESTQLVFSGIGNVHAVRDAFEEMRDSLDPVKTESKMDRWRDDSSKMVARRVVSFSDVSLARLYVSRTVGCFRRGRGCAAGVCANR